MTEKQQPIYIVKNVLCAGIVKRMAFTDGDIARYSVDGYMCYLSNKPLKNDYTWFTNEQDAQRYTKIILQNKLKALDKKRKKLEAMTSTNFSIVDCT